MTFSVKNALASLFPETILGEVPLLQTILFNRPGVVGAVLQTPLSLITSLAESPFSSKPSKYRHTQTVRAR